MNQNPLIDWLQLGSYGRTPCTHIEQLKTHTLSAQQALALLPKEDRSPLRSAEIDDTLRWIEASDHHHILTLTDPDYPPLLNEIANQPLVLYIIGPLDTLQRPQLAMVGSRNPSPAGIELASSFGHQLAKAGLTITSGLAIGIDSACHQAAVMCGKPTIAVLGNGLYSIYPKRHRQLAKQILDCGGALVSSFNLNSPPHKHHFPLRNRIISGLSLGTLIVEATLNSGSLITAKLAAEQNREVFAIPSSIHNPLAKGCHYLIKQGAKLTEKCEDIFEELGWQPLLETNSISKSISKPATSALDSAGRKLLECVEFSSTPTSLIIQRSGMSIQQALATLVNLQSCGYITPTYGGYSRVQ